MPAKTAQKNTPAPNGTLAKRPPVVVVMGHVDHGKTTLLDTIRKTKVAEREAGGITQSIGAYEIVVPRTNADNTRTNADTQTNVGKNADQREGVPRKSAVEISPRESASPKGRKITFIDTPGHEAFTKMRSRGAAVADIAILVVALDDGVQPQTKEAIKIIQDAKIPYIVALNKADKARSEEHKVKSQLAEAGVLLEGYGGSVSSEMIAAKTGEGVDGLLDLILLTADVEELKCDPAAAGEGFIIEAEMTSRRGPIATGIIKNGTLKVGDTVSAGSASGKVKGLENFLGKQIKEAVPCMPVVILGLTSLPAAGDMFRVGSSAGLGQGEAPIATAQKPAAQPAAMGVKLDQSSVNVILKADVAGSLEALGYVVRAIPLPKDTLLKIVAESVGDITDGDIQLAISTKSMIIGFRTKAGKSAEHMAEVHGVKIMQSQIVYELVKTLEAALAGKQHEVIAGDLEVLKVFGTKDKAQIVGGKVVVGEIKNNAAFELVRREHAEGTGRILNLQSGRKDVAAVAAGNECGLLVEADREVKVGDHVLLRQRNA